MPRPAALPVYLTLAVARASFFALYSTLSAVYRIREAGLDPLELVLVGTVLELSVFLLEVPTGVVADVYSRRLSIGIGYALIGVGFVVESLNPTFAAILLAQVIWGAGYTFTSGAGQAWIVDELGTEEIGPVFLRGSQVGQAGALVAMGGSVALASMGLWLPLFVAGVGYLAMAVFVFFVMPERGLCAGPSRSAAAGRPWAAPCARASASCEAGPRWPGFS